jgi:hypothetical protein
VACEDPEFRGSLLGTHPTVAPDAELRVSYRLRDGNFVPQTFAVESESPFNSEMGCAAWMLSVLSACDGSRSWREHHERAVREGLVAGDTPLDEFAGLLGRMAGQGILRLREHPLPPDAPGPDAPGPYSFEIPEQAVPSAATPPPD